MDRHSSLLKSMPPKAHMKWKFKDQSEEGGDLQTGFLFLCKCSFLIGLFVRSTGGQGNTNEDEEDELDGLMRTYELQAAKDLEASKPVVPKKVPRMREQLEDGLATKIDSANKYDRGGILHEQNLLSMMVCEIPLVLKFRKDGFVGDPTVHRICQDLVFLI